MREHNEELLKCVPIFFIFFFLSRKFIEHLYFCTRGNTVIAPPPPPKKKKQKQNDT